ncbi:MAG: substrate-binding domain-containing protein [Phycisphaerae bacterium]|nr:substrate-binding domain-containing protein [Phycisphaerae bacterium]
MKQGHSTILTAKTSVAREKLLQRILRGAYSVGQKIPTEPALVEDLGISRNTIREAVASLVHDGLLERRQGSGTYVIGNEPTSRRASFRKETVRMGIVLGPWDDVQHPSSFLLELMKGISEPIAEYPRLDVRYLTADPSYRNVGGVHFLDAATSGAIDVLVLTLVELEDAEVRLASEAIPLLFLGIECPWSRFPFVQWDLSAGVRKLVDFLVRDGRSDIGMLLDMPQGKSAAAFLSGAVAAMARRGLPPDVSRTVYTQRDESSIPQKVETLLRTGAKAIVCYDDDAAVRVIHHLLSKGLRVPRDVVVTGANDTLPAESIDHPSLTTLRVPLMEIGKTVRNLVFQAAQTGRIPSQTLLFEPELIVRDSAPAREEERKEL